MQKEACTMYFNIACIFTTLLYILDYHPHIIIDLEK